MKKVKDFVAEYKGKFKNKDLVKDLTKVVRLFFKDPTISISGDRFVKIAIYVGGFKYVYLSFDDMYSDKDLLYSLRDEITRVVIFPKRKKIYLEIAERFLSHNTEYGFCKEFGKFIYNSYTPETVIEMFPELGLFIGEPYEVTKGGEKGIDYKTDDGNITSYGNFTALRYGLKGDITRGMIALFCAEMCDEDLEISK